MKIQFPLKIELESFNCIAAFVIRAREWRNFVHHTEPKDIDAALFNQKWNEGCQIIQNLGLNYNTNRLKHISLDPKHDLVLKSLFTLIAKNENKQQSADKEISNLSIQLTNIEKEVQFLKENAVKHQQNNPLTGQYLNVATIF